MESLLAAQAGAATNIAQFPRHSLLLACTNRYVSLSTAPGLRFSRCSIENISVAGTLRQCSRSRPRSRHHSDKGIGASLEDRGGFIQRTKPGTHNAAKKKHDSETLLWIAAQSRWKNAPRRQTPTATSRATASDRRQGISQLTFSKI